jgi:hypothetical protein
VPTLETIGPYRFFFWSAEPGEPAHVHVQRDTAQAKFWLTPVTVARAIGFKQHELNQIEKIVIEHQQEWLEKWNGYFRNAK